MLQKRGKKFYVLFDEHSWNVFKQKAFRDHLIKEPEDTEKWDEIMNDGEPVLVKAENLQELADKSGMPLENLSETIDAWNSDVREERDQAFNREELEHFVKEGKVYLLEQKPRFASTLGRLRVNPLMQVLNKKGAPIQGLYAVGNIVGGYSSQNSAGPLRTTWALVSAFTCADHLEKEQKDQKAEK